MNDKSVGSVDLPSFQTRPAMDSVMYRVGLCLVLPLAIGAANVWASQGPATTGQEKVAHEKMAQEAEPADESQRTAPSSTPLDWHPVMVQDALAQWHRSLAQLVDRETADQLHQNLQAELQGMMADSDNPELTRRWALDRMVAHLPSSVRDRVPVPESDGEVPESLRDSENVPQIWFRNLLQLESGIRLVRQHQYDRALSVLANLPSDSVVFPSELLFYRGLCEFKLMEFASARTDLAGLLKHQEQLPRRTVTLARLMIADIPENSDVSLHQVARVMDDALRRQGLKEAGQRVLDQEQRVVDMLSQMIEEKEEQQRQQQQQSQAQSQQPSSKPMEQSRRAPLLGEGKVDPRHLNAKQWGDLPPEKQAEVIAEMTRQMPPHYKRVIEEYFRQLTEKRQ